MSFTNCGDYFTITTISSSLLNGEKRNNKSIRYNGDFSCFRVISKIAFVLATYYFTFFDGITKRKHLIANKKSTQNKPNINIQILSVKLQV